MFSPNVQLERRISPGDVHETVLTFQPVNFPRFAMQLRLVLIQSAAVSCFVFAVAALVPLYMLRSDMPRLVVPHATLCL